MPLRSASVFFDEEEIVFEVSGLEPGRPYQLGFTWWDYDSNGRVQTVRVSAGEDQEGAILMDKARLPAYTRRKEGPESMLLYLAPELVRTGSLRIVFAKDAGAHNAVVSEIWLWEGK